MTIKEPKKRNYLHGYSEEEQNRLRRQAALNEFSVHQGVNFSDVHNLIEVGCGVGAQSDILLRRFPNLHLTGIDFNTKQLAAATSFLGGKEYLKGRFEFSRMDASQMDFKSGQFDGAFLCWILEHVPEPARVLSEVRRVLRPGSPIYVTEVMNHSFFLDPYSPNLWRYWMAFNDYQYEHGGDPFVGVKLGNLLTQVGFKNVKTHVKTWFYDNRRPNKRKEYIEYWTDLLLSAKENLVNAKYVTEKVVEAATKELTEVRTDPNAVFYYSFAQAHANV